ncbi:hypothetical protein CEXT_439971 [Caerostris extrusa]|uniref:Uncharacterized protein n=1 Tax=Caerostris extrusa TaxID=172846 RepID=A0AAV4N5W7_CAEEX|nr:hypothetical protein CEXT_439971 [Caerostris extrusa]
MLIAVPTLQHLSLAKIGLTICYNSTMKPVMKLNAFCYKEDNENDILVQSAKEILKIEVPLLLKKKLLRYIPSIICEYKRLDVPPLSVSG